VLRALPGGRVHAQRVEPHSTFVRCAADRRGQPLAGYVDVESAARGGAVCTFRREEGDPLSWRLLWKEVVCSELLVPHLVRRAQG
jgi:hypothetical protein